MAAFLFKRQQCTNYDTQADCYTSFWWSNTGLAIRYAIVAVLFVLIAIFLMVSYLHAQRRVKRGLPPLGYHRWMLARRYQPQYNPNAYYMNGNMGHNGQGYGMPQYQQGPPAYNWDAPPQYQPPAGGSKAMANQNFGRNETSSDPTRPVAGMSQPTNADEVQYPPPSHPPPQHRREA
ncbi:hypothetical protein K461DRAFT_311164 [Myriangium duriaei CBS 260.36]|uniref:Uncharacterized protein n=1 Tax=Myriangium duriaei CBS 260.36 TaxID=1168546 RepID=A0A9P4J3H5_9PEZI|nr:hypothetical protein K461DRAFT_311164 [Myriangium duriaei CBS 260.36]